MRTVILLMLYVTILFVNTLPSFAKDSDKDWQIPFGEDNDHMQIGSIADGRELFALADSEEEAKTIADLYGITLVRFSFGVATFHTEENPSAVIARGVENGWPRLEINRTTNTFSGDGAKRRDP